jgi:hypothetical protein
MEFRRSGASDERRRRVLRDEITGGQDEEAASIPISSKRDRARRYTDGALAESQPRVTDFLPQRGFSALVVGLLLLTAVAAVITAHIAVTTSGLLAKEPRLAMFDLNGRGNIGQWFASLLFGGLALLSLVIYNLRMHRVDDFRGRYRVWLVAFVFCFSAWMLSRRFSKQFRRVQSWSPEVPCSVREKAGGWCCTPRFWELLRFACSWKCV